MDLSLQFRSDFMKYRCPGSGYHRHEITHYPWTISLVYRRIELAVPCAIYLCRVRLNIVRLVNPHRSVESLFLNGRRCLCRARASLQA